MNLKIGLPDQALAIDKDLVSFVDLKELIKQKLPESSIVRQLILSEPDAIPREIGLAKLLIYSRLLKKERS